MPEQQCPGLCNRAYIGARNAYQMAMAEYDPLDSSVPRPEMAPVQPAYGDPWCGKCKTVIAAQLAELDDLVPLRMSAADGYSADTSPQQNRGRAEPPSPSPGGDDADDTYQMLKAWEDHYRGDILEVRLASRRGSLAQKRTLCIDWLADHLGDILVSPMAADFGREVMEWHRALTSAAKASQRRLTKPMRCRNCQLLLSWREGENDVICANPACRTVMRYDEYEAEVERLVATRPDADVALAS